MASRYAIMHRLIALNIVTVAAVRTWPQKGLICAELTMQNDLFRMLYNFFVTVYISGGETHIPYCFMDKLSIQISITTIRYDMSSNFFPFFSLSRGQSSF